MFFVSEAQLQKIVSAINATHVLGWWQWVPVASVFVSALLAMLVGILLESYKNSCASARLERERQIKEIAGINVAIAGITYNIENLLHVSGQHILPHYNEVHAAYVALCEAGDNQERLNALMIRLSSFRALTRTYPELHFVELDFLRELSFMVEKDPELFKQSEWMRSQFRDLNFLIKKGNKLVSDSRETTLRNDGLTTLQLQSALHLQNSIAESQCLMSFQLFEIMLQMQQKMEAVNDTYKIRARRPSINPPASLAQTREELRKIVQ